MERRELITELKDFTGASFITRQQLAKFMGYKNPHGVDKYLYGLESKGRGKYFVCDVATSILQR